MSAPNPSPPFAISYRLPCSCPFIPTHNPQEHRVVSQWNPSELESITLNGHILLNSLGKWFAEKYLITAEDNSNSRHTNPSYSTYPVTKITYEKMQNKASVWRSSSSGRARQSGSDFTQSINRTYNHTLQTKPLHKLLPAEPMRWVLFVLFVRVYVERVWDMRYELTSAICNLPCMWCVLTQLAFFLPPTPYPTCRQTHGCGGRRAKGRPRGRPLLPSLERTCPVTVGERMLYTAMTWDLLLCNTTY